MVAAIFLVTLILFILADLILRKEDKNIYKIEKTKKSPIFISPEKALVNITNETKRLYHLSHSWVVTAFENQYNGFQKLGIDLDLIELAKADPLYPTRLKNLGCLY